MALRSSFIRLAGAGFLSLLAASQVEAETYQIDKGHSSVGFEIRHLVGRSKGRFNDFSGTIVYDEKAVDKSSVQATIQVGSIDTDNEKRDGHLKAPDFFDVEKYPEITFKSTKVEKAGDNKLLVTGDLTIHGTTKSVPLTVEVLGVGIHPFNNAPVAGFATETTIKRSDYGVNTWIDKAGVLGDEVKISITVEAGKPQ